MKSYSGGCHCGGLHVQLGLSVDSILLTPRQCDCSFCTKHGAAYVSDPQGNLVIVEHRPDCWREYRQGSNSATFLLCSDCGVLVGVLFVHASGAYGAVNLKCLDEQSDWGSAVTASPSLLDVETRTARWMQLWFANVVIRRWGQTSTVS